MVKQGESNYLGNDEIKEMCNNWKNEIVWKEVFETENVEDDMNVISLNDDGGVVEGMKKLICFDSHNHSTKLKTHHFDNVQNPPEEAGTVNDGGTLEGMNVEYGGALEEGTNIQDPSKEAKTVKDGGRIVGGNIDTVAINVEHGGALEVVQCASYGVQCTLMYSVWVLHLLSGRPSIATSPCFGE